jgi:hypothetical protein
MDKPVYLKESYFDFLCPMTVIRAVDLYNDPQSEVLQVDTAALNVAATQKVEFATLQTTHMNPHLMNKMTGCLNHHLKKL